MFKRFAVIASFMVLISGGLVSGDTPSSASDTVKAPKPYGALPSARQLGWHQLEFYGFLHFTVNTFTNREWGLGDENPDVFNPTDFSADQIVETAKMAGMKALILTCKHHDGFCLWPSKYTEHSVKNSRWRNGKGDVVRAISDACRRHGLKFGIYLSPWDRNHKDYGRPAYITYYRNQLRELLTEYGPIFELWWDGANGGTGYYGGAREKRVIDRSTYYDWQHTLPIVRHLQPNCVIFSDAGPDVRWVGNERGIAGDPCWETYTPVPRKGETVAVAGTTESRRGMHGTVDGKYWMPAECDVSIRPGWFYHPRQDAKVRSPKNLVDLYYASVGRGASFLLNLPPDRRGRIAEPDVKNLREFRTILDQTFAVNLAANAKLAPSNTRGGSKRFRAANLLDGDRTTYWTTDDNVTEASIVLVLPRPTTFNVMDVREYLPLGQRVRRWTLEQWQDGKWVKLANGQSIGNRRLWRGKPVTAQRLRLRVSGPVCPALSEFGLYLEPTSNN